MAARKKAAAPKRGASRYQEPASKPVHPIIWIVTGLIVGLFIMSLFQLEPGKDSIKRDKEAVSKKSNSVKVDKKNQADAQDSKPKFEFYTILPESEVIVPPDVLPEKAPPPPTEKEIAATKKADAARAKAILEGKTPPPAPPRQEVTQFYLQAGSFPSRETAERVRAQLLLTGQNVHIETGQVASKTWHRVLVGPFASREQLDSAQQQLANSGFKNLLLQQRKARI